MKLTVMATDKDGDAIRKVLEDVELGDFPLIRAVLQGEIDAMITMGAYTKDAEDCSMMYYVASQQFLYACTRYRTLAVGIYQSNIVLTLQLLK